MKNCVQEICRTQICRTQNWSGRPGYFSCPESLRLYYHFPLDRLKGENELDISTVSDDHELMDGEELIQVGEYRIKIPLPPSLVASSGKEGEPRLMITHLENENFKSYAQVNTIDDGFRVHTGQRNTDSYHPYM